MSKLIPPTPGRVVWYWPSQHEIDAHSIHYNDPTQPIPGIVAYVHSDREVNLGLIDQAGRTHPRTNVRLLQEDDARPHTSEGPFATWMPFQLGQAAALGASPVQEAQADIATLSAAVASLPEPASTIGVGTVGLFYPHAFGDTPPSAVEAEVTHVWGPECVNLHELGSESAPTSVLVFASQEVATDKGCSGYYFIPGATLPTPSDSKPEEPAQA